MTTDASLSPADAPRTLDVPDGPEAPDEGPVAVYVGVRLPDAPTADPLGRLAAALAPLGFVGTAIDGEGLGAPGWLVACTIGDGKGTVMRWERGADGSDLVQDLPWERVRAAVAAELGAEVQVGRHLVTDHGTFPGETTFAAPRVDGAESREVVVGSFKAGDEALWARSAKAPIAVASFGGTALVGPASGEPTELTGVVGYAKGPALLLWRTGPWEGVFVQRGLRHQTAHTWGPEWRAVVPAGSAETDPAVEWMLATLRMPRASGEDVANVLRLPEGDRRRQVIELVGHEDPVSPVRRLLALLEMPVAADDVLSGRITVGALPGATVHKPQSLWRVLTADPPKSSDAATATLPGMVATSSGRRWWQWPESWVASKVRKALILPVFGAGTWYMFSVGSNRAWFMLGTGVLVVLVDLVLPWLNRRTAEADDAPDEGAAR